MSDHITSVTIHLDDMTRDVPTVRPMAPYLSGTFAVTLGAGTQLEGSAENLRKLALHILSNLPLDADASDLERARLFLLRTVDLYSMDIDATDALQLIVALIESDLAAAAASNAVST